MYRLYTTKDIADRLGVPKQQVYRYIADQGYEPIEHTTIRGKVAYVYDEETFKKVEEYFRMKNEKFLTDDVNHDTVNERSDAVKQNYDALHKGKTASENETHYTVLLERIEFLEKQINQKDEQIRSLLRILDKQQN